jgi:uncharacterized phage protein (TIGR02216 family)
VIGAGLGLLRLSPVVFWSMTPREFAAAMSVVLGPPITAPTRGDLAALMTRFPDRPSPHRHHKDTAHGSTE